MTNAEMLEVLQLMEDMAKCDKDAGRIVEAARKERLVKALRAVIKPKPRGFQRGNKLAGKGFN
jgi:hypothetical protein